MGLVAETDVMVGSTALKLTVVINMIDDCPNAIAALGSSLVANVLMFSGN